MDLRIVGNLFVIRYRDGGPLEFQRGTEGDRSLGSEVLCGVSGATVATGVCIIAHWPGLFLRWSTVEPRLGETTACRGISPLKNPQ